MLFYEIPIINERQNDYVNFLVGMCIFCLKNPLKFETQTL